MAGRHVAKYYRGGPDGHVIADGDGADDRGVCADVPDPKMGARV
jgi:hypothetical protein